MEVKINKAIIAGSKKDFDEIKKNLDINNAQLILWKPDFSLISNKENTLPEVLGDRINKKHIDNATKDIHVILKSWYRNKKGDDLSIVDGCSLGLVFESSLELLLYNISQTYLGLLEISNQYEEIFMDNADEPVKTFVANWLTKKFGLQIRVINVKQSKKNKSLFHPMLGFRYLESHFIQGNIFDRLAFIFMKLIQPKPKNPIFMQNSGKLDEYFENHFRMKNPFFKLLLPISRKLRLNFKFNQVYFWKRAYNHNNNNNEVFNEIKLNIKNLGWNQETKVIPISLIKESISEFCTPYWPSALNYYFFYKKLFKAYKPNLAFYGTDGSEIPLISAYAAKSLKIPTLMMPHGVAPWGPYNMRKTLEGPIKYYCTIGPFDSINFNANGIPVDNVIKAKLPWFSKSEFRTLKNKKDSFIKKKAMLLPLDTGFSLHLNANTIHRHIIDMIDICDKCNIEIYGIKFRSIDEIKSFGLKLGNNILYGKKINVFGGYGNLSSYFNKIDMVIGPLSSASAECSIANMDYYHYHDYSMYEENPNIYKSPTNIFHIASNKKSLETNILSNQIFKSGHDKNSLVNISSSFDQACDDLNKILCNIANE